MDAGRRVGNLRPRERSISFAIAAALAWAPAIPGCVPGVTEDASDFLVPVAGGTCVVGYFSDLDALNEFVSTDANATDVMENLLYMPLLRWSEDIDIEGRLAESWERSEDGRTITLQLRDDVRWHDGVPTTSDDVVFSFARFRDPALGWPDIGSLRHLETVEALGPYSVRFRFDLAYAEQLADLRRVIMPKHLLASVPVAEMDGCAFNRNPVGNGPFRFVRWKQQQEIVFEANPDFAGGRPWLDRVVIRVIPDQTAIETTFLSGEIDIVETLRPEQVGAMRKNPRVRVHTYPQRGYQFIGWNLRDPLFADAPTRRALTHAIDRWAIVDALVFGEGKVTASPVMTLSPYYDHDLEPWPFDPAEARRLLAEAGWADADGDGILDRDGVPFEFELVTNFGNRLREDTLVMIQDQLARVGVRANPQVREWSLFLDQVLAKDFQAFHMAWQSDFVLDPYALFHSASIEGKYNMVSFADDRVDGLIERGTTARTREEAIPIWREFQEILHAEQPYTILYELDYSLGASRRMRGVKIDARGTFRSVEDWWIAPGDRKYAS